MSRRKISLGAFVLFYCVTCAVAAPTAPVDPWAYWQTQRRGANCFNESVDRTYFASASKANIRLLRLTWSKWKGEGRDFLLGDADAFEKIPAADLARLKAVLDDCHAEGINVVVTPLSLPGLRWRQQNGGKFDDRLWKDERYHIQAAKFWRDLATELRGHPAIVGYNLLNEPAPARALKVELADADTRAAFDAKVAGTPADTNRLYRTLIAAVREVDQITPIVLDTSDFAAPAAIDGLLPVADPRVIYSVHFYEPWIYTNFKQNGGQRTYPGEMEIDGRKQVWNRQAIGKQLEPVVAWAKKHRVPPGQFFLGEFGCDRRVAGAGQYLSDMVDTANALGWHWAFYAYREDSWDAMDYELGTGKLPWSYWQAIERGEKPVLPRRDNPLWHILAKQFAPPGPQSDKK